MEWRTPSNEYSPAFVDTLRAMKISVEELRSLVEQVLVRHGVAAARAPAARRRRRRCRRQGPTTDPDAVLRDGALLPFGGVKGGSLAFMIEVLATMGGARFGFEDSSGKIPGAVTSNAGQFLLLIDPRPFGDSFLDRIEALIEHLRDAGTGRLPGDLRYERRRIAERDGLDISPEMHDYLTRKGRHVSAA